MSLRALRSISGALEDQNAIEQLVVVKYGAALDAFDGAAYAALFTDEGVLDLVGNEFKGRGAIEGMFKNPASMGPPPKPGDPPRAPRVMPKLEPGQILVPHVITNTSYQIVGNTATGRCYFQEITTVAGKPQIVNVGHCDDTLRKEGGVWKFVRRNIMQDHPPASRVKTTQSPWSTSWKIPAIAASVLRSGIDHLAR
jgi:SnoaL-like domain